MLTDQQKPNHFAFFTPNKNYHLRADVTQDAEAWVEKLKETLEFASQQVLSSSFQRLSILDEVEKDFQSPFRSPITKPVNNRHSISASQMPLQNSSFQQAAPGIARPHFPKRHSINVASQASSLFSSMNQRLPTDMSASRKPMFSAKVGSIDYLNNVSRSVESATSTTTRESYNSASIFSGKDDMGQFSYPSDHGSPMVISDLRENSDRVKVKHLTPHADSSAAVVVHDDDFDEQEVQLAPPKSEEKILESGHLLRLKKRYKQWRSQWVVLSNERLVFYKTEKSKSPVKVISIENLIDVVELDALSKSKQYCMQLITPEKRMRFCAPSEEDLIRWLAAIKAVIDESPITASIAYDLIEEE